MKNTALVHKLDSIVMDIKYYVNINASIALDDPNNAFNLMTNEEINELIDIRQRIKKLNNKLKEKL